MCMCDVDDVGDRPTRQYQVTPEKSYTILYLAEGTKGLHLLSEPDKANFVHDAMRHSEERKK